MSRYIRVLLLLLLLVVVVVVVVVVVLVLLLLLLLLLLFEKLYSVGFEEKKVLHNFFLLICPVWEPCICLCLLKYVGRS